MAFFEPGSLTGASRALVEEAGSSSAGTVDYNIHGLLGIRLIDPSPADVRTMGRQLGLSPTAFSGEPGITIRFVEELSLDGPLRYLGRDDVGFTDDAFVVLRSRDLGRARARLAFEAIGQACDMTCERGLASIPLLKPLMNLAMLGRGIVPAHATAFNYKGHGVLVTGWAHGSKTGTLLAFMAEGAEFVGDEWIYLCPARNRMYGLADQLEARPWYLRELPEYRRQVSSADRLRIAATRGLAGLLSPFVPASERRNSLVGKLVRHAHHALLNQQSVHLQPARMFDPQFCTLEAEPHSIIVAVSHESDQVVVEPTPIEHVAKQMAASFRFEQATLASFYQKHLFAFPDRRNGLLDQTERFYRKAAMQALSGKRAYTMFHPYPVSPQALRNAIRPLLG